MNPNYIRVPLRRHERRLIASELDCRFDQAVSGLLKAAHVYVDSTSGATKTPCPCEALQDLIHAAADMVHARDARAAFANAVAQAGGERC